MSGADLKNKVKSSKGFTWPTSAFPVMRPWKAGNLYLGETQKFQSISMQCSCNVNEGACFLTVWQYFDVIWITCYWPLVNGIMTHLNMHLYPQPGLSWQQCTHQMSGISSGRTSFHIDGLLLLWSASHSLGRNPQRTVIPFNLIWFVAHRGTWWNRLLSWLSRNKPYQIRHIGLSVLAHTMGINWSSNTTDKSIPSFPPWALRPIGRPCHLINRASPANRRRAGGWLTMVQRWAQEGVRKRESIRKPLAAGVKVTAVSVQCQCTEKHAQTRGELQKMDIKSVTVLLCWTRDLLLLCRCGKQTNKPPHKCKWNVRR